MMKQNDHMIISSILGGSDGAIHYSDIIDECKKKKFDDASQWLLEDWI